MNNKYRNHNEFSKIFFKQFFREFVIYYFNVFDKFIYL